jgi:glycosyltransferase involved in cell wall biosynthesis
MKILVLSSAKREPDFSSVFEHLGKQLELDLKILDKTAQRNLRRFLSAVDLSCYDRILVDLRFKHIYRQTGFLSQLSGLLIYEEDACQNYLKNSRWHGMFSRFYRNLPNARIVVTGAGVAERLRQEGFNVHFIPKGYDPGTIFSENIERDIELGFIGRTASVVYGERKKLLEQLASEDSLQILRTEPGAPYRKTLNRIRYFVSADIGLSEYMAKNFEAMACGCVLLAYRQGNEETAIGLEDGVHVLLYSNIAELREHLARLRGNPELGQKIADAGRKFVEQSLSHPRLAARLAELLQMPPLAPKQISRWQAFLRKFYFF